MTSLSSPTIRTILIFLVAYIVIMIGLKSPLTGVLTDGLSVSESPCRSVARVGVSIDPDVALLSTDRLGPT